MIFINSSRVMPGLRAMPDVTTTISESAVSSYRLVPLMRCEKPMIGEDCEDIEGFALGQTFYDVEHHNISDVVLDEALGQASPDVTCADDGNFHICLDYFIFAMMASATCEVPTARFCSFSGRRS